MRRRTLLATGAGAAGAAAFAGVTPARAATPPAASPLQTFQVQGSDLTVTLLPGQAATILLYVARRFHYEIDTLGPGDLRADPTGTVLDIRPGWYPPGASGGFLPHQLVVVRDILAECDGLVRWGGDDAAEPREGRFALGVRPAEPRLSALAGRMDRDEAAPGRRLGAGLALPFTAARIRRAEALRAKRQ
ncbi:MAG: hypothetical protein ABW000_04605 [Actinoplanes sp.]